ncbi:hypothetical protein DYB32_006991 [Aphanomyces invadans]|uniref:Isochorismatase-like domain-containing protein n=1 Tax=Aphanomyces invadans TaxID=157072 RepID=A0A418AQB5_9STRA|nr:hypothetical protein DYB32_006991 [Aphanomyces invadans]
MPARMIFLPKSTYCGVLTPVTDVVSCLSKSSPNTSNGGNGLKNGQGPMGKRRSDRRKAALEESMLRKLGVREPIVEVEEVLELPPAVEVDEQGDAVLARAFESFDDADGESDGCNVQAAKTLHIPTIATTQYAARFGETVPEIQLGPDAKTFDKTLFSMLTDDVRGEVDAVKPKSVILCGIEAHVCVLQTCLDLVEQGYDVHVPVDAVSSSTALLRSTALTRLQQSGVYLTSVESIVFQLVGDSKHPDFRAISSLIKQHSAVICTTHDAANSDARTPPELHLDDGCSCHDKTVFSMLSADVRRAIDARHPKSIVLCGVEAHVCVLQTCLDLVEDGYQVHVAVDAVSSSTAFLRATALERLKQSGVFLTTVESLVFQWVPDSNHPAFDDMTELNKQHTAIPSAFH